MATEEQRVVYVWEGDASDLNRVIDGLERNFEGLEKKTGDAGREMERTTRKVKETDRSLGGLSRAIRTTTSGFAVMGRAGGKGTRILGALAGSLTRAATQAGVAGIAMVGLGAGIALTIGAVGAISVGLASVTANARELRIEAEQFPGLVKQSDVDRLVETDDALDATLLAVKGMGAAIVVEFAPALEKGLVAVTAFSLAVQDMPGGILRALDAVMFLGRGIGESLIQSFTDPIGAMERQQEAIAQFSLSVARAGDIVGDYIPQAEALIQTYSETAQAAEDAEEATRNKSTADKQAVEDAKALAKAQAAQAAALTIIQQARADTLTDEERLQQTYMAQLAAIDKLAEAGAEEGTIAQARTETQAHLERQLLNLQNERRIAAEAAAAATAAEMDASLKQVDQAIALIEADMALTTQAIGETLGSVGDIAGAMSDRLAAEGKKGARALAISAKASGIAQALISTYVGASKALAIGGPFAVGLVPAAIAAGLAQVAAIAAVPLPAAHVGTFPTDPGSLAPDESIRGGRRTLNSEISAGGAVADPTASSLINDANNGRLSGGGSQRIVAVIGRSHLDQELFRSGRNGTSRYARDLRTNPHPSPQQGH